jgi:YD repeat-containing protein
MRVLLFFVFLIFVAGFVSGDMESECDCNPGGCSPGEHCSSTAGCRNPGPNGNDLCVPYLEICDGIDNDGDGIVDEDCDNDGDGYCELYFDYDNEWPYFPQCLEGFGDCMDEDGNSNPGASEVCDGFDNNCNDMHWLQYWEENYLDYDPPIDYESFVERGVDEDFDNDGDGVTTCGSYTWGSVHGGGWQEGHDPDCNDNNPDVWREIVYYRDSDGDEYGDPYVVTSFCVGEDTNIDGWSLDGTDCDDSNSDAWELLIHYLDNDGDGCGNEDGTPTELCAGDSPAEGWSFNTNDCDDNNNQRCSIFYERCDGIDNDCYGGVPSNEDDCEFAVQYVYEYNPLVRVIQTYFMGVTDVFVENEYSSEGSNEDYTFRKVIDQLGNYIVSKSDKFGDVIEVEDAKGNKPTFDYDSLSRLEEGMDSDGRQAFENEYNTLNQLVWSYSIDSGERTYDYDSNGNLEVTTIYNNPDSNSNNNVGNEWYTIMNEYDYLNRLFEIVYSDGEDEEVISYFYDNLDGTSCIEGVSTSYGKLCKIVGDTTIEYTYDLRGNVIRTGEVIGIREYETVYGYDYAGNVVSIVGYDGVETTYEYNSLNQLDGVDFYDHSGHSLVGGHVSYEYGDENTGGEKVGSLKNIVYPSFVTDYEYNQRGIVESIENPLFWETYDYDDVGNLLNIVDIDGNFVEYGYDDIYRLTEISDQNEYYLEDEFTIGYDYDSVGNRLSRAVESQGVEIYGIVLPDEYYYGSDNKLDSTVGCTYDYDDVGNLIESDCQRIITNYEYYLNGMLKSVSGENFDLDFVYDPLGRRVRKIDNENWIDSALYLYGVGNSPLITITSFDELGGSF